jgi:hypothetical protein
VAAVYHILPQNAEPSSYLVITTPTKQKEEKSDVMALAPVATVRVLGNSNADAHQTKAVYRLR